MAKFPWQKGYKGTPVAQNPVSVGKTVTTPKPPPQTLPRPARDWGGELAKEYWKHGRKKL